MSEIKEIHSLSLEPKGVDIRLNPSLSQWLTVIHKVDGGEPEKVTIRERETCTYHFEGAQYHVILSVVKNAEDSATKSIA